jgi:hypothetical protein
MEWDKFHGEPEDLGELGEVEKMVVNVYVCGFYVDYVLVLES